MRPVTACDACRSNKRKCRLDSNDTICTRCRELTINCSLRGWTVRSPYTIPTHPTLRLAPHPPRSPETPTPSYNDGPSVELQQELVRLYFLVVHDTHHSIFHRPTVEQQITDGEFPEVLLYSVMALGAPFSDNQLFANIDRRRRGDQYTARARGLLDLTDISVTTIQASILLATVCFCDSQTETEALYYSIAIRLALILDLPNRKCDDQLGRQVNLRIWWSLYMIDIWSSMGLNLPRQLDFVERYPLPASEEVFLSLRPGVETPANVVSPGLCSEMAILARKWARIHHFNKTAVNSFIDSQSVSVTVDSFARELQAWSDSLPSYLQETPDNLERYCSLGLGNAFAALHLGYHYYNEVLFYQFLARRPNQEHFDSISWYRSQCEEHALAFCNLLYRCRSTNQLQFHCLYVMVGHMLVVTSTVYIHMLVSSDNEVKIKLARQRLGQNFQILTEMRTYWVSLDIFLSRLQVFHNACIRSIDESFRMDQWMLSFLLEHGTTVMERPLDGDSPDTLRNWFLQTF